MVLAVKLMLHPSVLIALWLGLLAVRMQAVSREIATAIQSQTKIGWDQLYHR